MDKKHKMEHDTTSGGSSRKKMKVQPAATCLPMYRHVKNNVLERVLSSSYDSWMVYDAQHTFGLVDIRPATHGHLLVVCKEPAGTLLEPISDAAMLAMSKDVQAMTRAVQQVTGCEGVKVEQMNGPAAGQTVPQLHYHVLPCYNKPDWALKPAAERVEIPDADAGQLTAALRNTLPVDYAPGFHYWAATADDMEALGHVLHQHFNKPGNVILLDGQLGAGKSTICRGVVRAFCGDPLLDVPSPTFLLCLTYEDDLAHDEEAKRASSTPRRIHHMDPYRLGQKTDRLAGLLEWEVALSQDVCLIEWPDRMPKGVMALAKSGISIHISGYGSQGAGRLVRITALSDDTESSQILDRWRSAGLPAAGTSWRSAPTADASLSSHTQDGAGLQRQASGRAAVALPEDPAQWVVLGIESSCDDTAAAVVTGDGRVLAHEIASQVGVHEVWGGVKPDAARDAHAAAIVGTVESCLQKAGVTPEALTAVAVTIGPGLSLCLQVGVRHALQLAAQHLKPVVPVHHMEAHTLMARMPHLNEQPLKFPALLLLVSGGHNMLVLCTGVGKYRIIGTTLDDSVGECFDKIARLLGFPNIPGGPRLEKLALRGQAVHKITMPMQNGSHRDSCNFSFSGLKTSVGRLLDDVKAKLGLSGHSISLDVTEQDVITCAVTASTTTTTTTTSSPAPSQQADGVPAEQQPVQSAEPAAELTAAAAEVVDASVREAYLQQAADVAASFTKVAVSFLQQRTSRALQWLQEDCAQQGSEPVSCLVVAGGVAANAAVRTGLQEVAARFNIPCICPPAKYCTDNGLMVAWTGVERLKLGLFQPPPAPDRVEQNINVLPRWPLGPVDPRSAAASALSKMYH